MLRIGWFSSGNGIGSMQLLSKVNQEISDNNLEASIEFVFTNKDPDEGKGVEKFCKFVQSLEIPLINISSNKFKSKNSAKNFDDIRSIYDDKILTTISHYNIDLIVMAGYMLFTDNKLCNEFFMLNLHPAPPNGPQGTWQKIIENLINNEYSYAGAQIQIATTNRDQGPIISYCTFPINNNEFYNKLWLKLDKQSNIQSSELFHQIRTDILKREPHLMVETLKSLVSEEIILERRENFNYICLNEKIEKSINSN